MTFKELLIEKFNSRDFDKLMKRVNQASKDVEADGIDFTDEIASDMAKSELRMNKGLEDYIKKEMDVGNALSWLVDQY